MTFRNLLQQFSPRSRWHIGGIGLTATAGSLLADEARFGDYLRREVEYLAPYAITLGGESPLDRCGALAVKVR